MRPRTPSVPTPFLLLEPSPKKTTCSFSYRFSGRSRISGLAPSNRDPNHWHIHVDDAGGGGERAPKKLAQLIMCCEGHFRASAFSKSQGFRDAKLLLFCRRVLCRVVSVLMIFVVGRVPKPRCFNLVICNFYSDALFCAFFTPFCALICALLSSLACFCV